MPSGSSGCIARASLSPMSGSGGRRGSRAHAYADSHAVSIAPEPGAAGDGSGLVSPSGAGSGSGSGSSAAEWSASSVVVSLGLLAVWYASGAASTVVNSSVMHSFPYPVLFSASHLLSSALIDLWIIRKRNIKIPFSTNLVFVCIPIALTLTLGKTLTYLSLVSVPASLTHTVKASSPVFSVFLTFLTVRFHALWESFGLSMAAATARVKARLSSLLSSPGRSPLFLPLHSTGNGFQSPPLNPPHSGNGSGGGTSGSSASAAVAAVGHSGPVHPKSVMVKPNGVNGYANGFHTSPRGSGGGSNGNGAGSSGSGNGSGSSSGGHSGGDASSERELPGRTVLAALVPITIGVTLSAVTEIHFHWAGFVSALVSLVFNVGHSMLSKRALRSRAFRDPLVMHMYTCFAACFFLLPLVVFHDVAAIRGAALRRLSAAEVAAHTASTASTSGTADAAAAAAAAAAVVAADPESGGIPFAQIGASVLLHYLQNVSSFYFLARASVLTHQVANTCKRLLIIVCAVLWFRNPVHPLNALGMLMALAGFFAYGIASKFEAQQQQHQQHHHSGASAAQQHHAPHAHLSLTTATPATNSRERLPLLVRDSDSDISAQTPRSDLSSVPSASSLDSFAVDARTPLSTRSSHHSARSYSAGSERDLPLGGSGSGGRHGSESESDTGGGIGGIGGSSAYHRSFAAAAGQHLTTMPVITLLQPLGSGMSGGGTRPRSPSTSDPHDA